MENFDSAKQAQNLIRSDIRRFNVIVCLYSYNHEYADKPKILNVRLYIIYIFQKSKLKFTCFRGSSPIQTNFLGKFTITYQFIRRSRLRPTSYQENVI